MHIVNMHRTQHDHALSCHDHSCSVHGQHLQDIIHTLDRQGSVGNDTFKETNLRIIGVMKLEHAKLKEELRVAESTLNLRSGCSY